MSACTPGPWIYEDAVQTHVIRGAEETHHESGYDYQFRGYVASTWGGQHEANARLIAAAPDLLEAVRSMDVRLRECFELGHQITAQEIYDSFYQEIVANAIAKATGGAA